MQPLDRRKLIDLRALPFEPLSPRPALVCGVTHMPSSPAASCLPGGFALDFLGPFAFASLSFRRLFLQPLRASVINRPAKKKNRTTVVPQ